MTFLKLFSVALLLALLVSCGSDEAAISLEVVKTSLEAKPVRLEAEQVVLTQPQYECGLKEELWQQATEKFGDRTIARLSQRARDLMFDDEVTVTEPGFRLPYVQVRGELPVKVSEVISFTERTRGIWDAEAKISVVIQHACFPKPLPLMGVKKGKFSQEVNPVFQFRKKGVDYFPLQLVH